MVHHVPHVHVVNTLQKLTHIKSKTLFWRQKLVKLTVWLQGVANPLLTAEVWWVHSLCSDHKSRMSGTSNVTAIHSALHSARDLSCIQYIQTAAGQAIHQFSLWVRIIIVPVEKDPKLELSAIATVNAWFWGSCACSRGMWNIRRRNRKDTGEPGVLRGECPNNFLPWVFPSPSFSPSVFSWPLSLLSPLSNTGQRLATQMVKVNVCDSVS